MGKPTIGYRYRLGVHMILCHGPIDSITKIEVDGRTAWSGSAADQQIQISALNLFGGDEREGGVAGKVDIEMGGPAQARNSYLQSLLGAAIPAYRGVVGAVLRRCYMGMNPYMKRWAFWGTRRMVRQNGIAQWYPEKVAIGPDMNPSHILRECLTDPGWGMGYPELDMEDDTFRSAADQLHAEGMGMSILWDKSMPLGDFIDIVLDHIDGALYTSRSTGKFVLKLARGGYAIDDLLLLDEDSVNRITDFKRNTVAELVNSVSVGFWDGETGKDNSVTVQDIALAAQQGSTIGTTIQYPGFTNGTIASKVASRDLKALSTPLCSGTIYATRKASSLNVGDVFRLSWPRYGIVQVVMRVVNMEFGELTNNLIKITAIEDAFALGSAIYAAPPSSEWGDPILAPSASVHHAVFESPFWEVVQRDGETVARAISPTSGFVQATAVRSASASNAKLFTNPTGLSYEEAATVDFCPTCLLDGAASPTTTIFAIDDGVDLDLVRIGSYAMIDEECVSVLAISETSMTVGRGVLDTVPKGHADNSRLFFVDDFSVSDGVEYAQTETARIKIAPTTGLGTLDPALAPEQSVVIAARAPRPYPPARLRLNGFAYPTDVSGIANLVVTWNHRDRLQQTASLVATEAASIGPEAGTTYTIELRTEAGVLISTASGVVAATHTFTLVDMGANYGNLRVLLWSVRDGIASYQKHDWIFSRPAP